MAWRPGSIKTFDKHFIGPAVTILRLGDSLWSLRNTPVVVTCLGREQSAQRIARADEPFQTAVGDDF